MEILQSKTLELRHEGGMACFVMKPKWYGAPVKQEKGVAMY